MIPLEDVNKRHSRGVDSMPPLRRQVDTDLG